MLLAYLSWNCRLVQHLYGSSCKNLFDIHLFFGFSIFLTRYSLIVLKVPLNPNQSIFRFSIIYHTPWFYTYCSFKYVINDVTRYSNASFTLTFMTNLALLNVLIRFYDNMVVAYFLLGYPVYNDKSGHCSGCQRDQARYSRLHTNRSYKLLNMRLKDESQNAFISST